MRVGQFHYLSQPLMIFLDGTGRRFRPEISLWTEFGLHSFVQRPARIDKTPDIHNVFATYGDHMPAINTEDGRSDRKAMLQNGLIHPAAVGIPAQDYCSTIRACGYYMATIGVEAC